MFIRPHPAVTEDDRLELPFIYDKLIEPFFRVASDYIVERDSDLGIARFTHVPSGYYVLWAKNTHIIGRPDITLPWGCVRVRVWHNGDYLFYNRRLVESIAELFVCSRVPTDASTVDGVSVRYSSTLTEHIMWHRTEVDGKTAVQVRAQQYDRIHQFAAAQQVMEEAAQERDDNWRQHVLE